MNCDLKYGKEVISIEVPERANILEVREPEFDINKSSFTQSFELKLPMLQEAYKNIGIIVSDKTRLCGYPDYLPWVIESLLKKGALKENIKFFIAYGTHPRQSEEESLNSYGPIYNEFEFIHHNCRENEAFEELGSTGRGTPITVRKDILECTLLITFGAISHHYFAGYGGGRKLLFPGLARRDAVYQNHGLFLDRQAKQLAADCQPGKLDGNPLAEDLKEIDDILPSKISIHGLLNSKGKVCRLMTGSNYEDFKSACTVHDSFFRSGVEQKFDLVIASSGGYPKDINFIQAHKSVHHAAAFVKNGGKLIILSECIDGIASDYFLKYLEAGEFEKAFEMLDKNYEGNGGTALSMMTKTSRVNIFMLTSLNEKICSTLNVTRISSNDIQKLIDKEAGSVAVIGNASMLVK